MREGVEASLAQLVEHPPCKRKVLGSIPRGGTSFVTSKNRLRELWLLFFCGRMSFYFPCSRTVLGRCLVLRRGISMIHTPRSGNALLPLLRDGFSSGRNIVRREFSSSASSWSFPTRSFAFFTLSSLGIVGGFYVMSYSMKVIE